MWYLWENKEDYEKAINRFEEIRCAEWSTLEHKKKCCSYIFSNGETKTFPVTEIDPIEMIKIRMEDFSFIPNQLGSKTSVSQGLNYKRPLSLNMIRRFSKKLKILTAFWFRSINWKFNWIMLVILILCNCSVSSKK